MLSQKESSNCKDLLRNLPPSDMMSLCETVTNRIIAPTTSEEAMDAVLLYTKSPEELLGRKKVKADVLFQYLQSLQASGVTPRSSKTELISKILDLWKDSSTRNVSQTRSDPKIQVFYTAINNYNFTTTQNTEDVGRNTALLFINWFYPILNGVRESEPGRWGPQHFRPATRLRIIDAKDITNEEFEGSEVVSEKLSSLILQGEVILNPHTTQNGFRGIISLEGLLKVAVCGTLERGDIGSVGVFEQCFVLSRDVDDGHRWKIEQCQLQIRFTGDGWQPPNILSLTEDTIKSLEN